MTTYRYPLNDDEGVTVCLFSKGGGKIYIRARKPDRSPLNVVADVLRQLSDAKIGPTEMGDALEEHGLEVAASSPKTYREEISWPGEAAWRVRFTEDRVSPAFRERRQAEHLLSAEPEGEGAYLESRRGPGGKWVAGTGASE